MLRPMTPSEVTLFSVEPQWSCSPGTEISQDNHKDSAPLRSPTPSFLTSCHSSTRPQSPRNKQIQSAGFWAVGQLHSRASHLPITSRAPALPCSIPYHVRENNPPPSPTPRLPRTKLRQLRTSRCGRGGRSVGWSPCNTEGFKTTLLHSVQRHEMCPQGSVLPAI